MLTYLVDLPTCSFIDVHNALFASACQQVTATSIANHIPVIMVGKPGASKTLTMQIVASSMTGPSSRSPLWSQLPAITIYSYQCSPLSTASSIEAQ